MLFKFSLDFSNYYYTSEQKNTAVGLGVLVDKNGVKFKFSYDRRMIDVLAENCNVEAIEILESLRRLERKLGRGSKVVSKTKK